MTLLPRFFQGFQGLSEPIAAVVIRNPVHIVGPGESAASNAQLQPALADVVDSSHLFGDAQGVVKWQHINGGADTHAPGAGSNGTGDGYGRGKHRSGGIEVELRQPGPVQAPLFGSVHLAEAFFKGFSVGDVLLATEFHKHAKVHCSLLISAR
jgi:hypothetical protein